jgi:hypothetical protein
MAAPCQNCPMKARIRLLERIVLEGETYTPDFDEAIEAGIRGDWGPYKRLRAAGKLPKMEEKGGNGKNSALCGASSVNH